MENKGDRLKLPLDKRFIPIYQLDGQYTNAFKALYKSNRGEDNTNLRYVYNEKTNRFIKKTDIYDKRSVNKRIKTKYAKTYNVKDNVFGSKKTYYNTLYSEVHEFRGGLKKNSKGKT